MSVACLDCQRLRADLESALRARDNAIRGRDAAVIDMQNLEAELRAKRSIISKLRGELEDKADENEANSDAYAVFVYWKGRLHPSAKSFKGKRRANVLARLAEGYTISDLMMAVDGAVVDAWTGPNGVRHDDLEFICRDPSTTDRFIKAAKAREGKVDEWLLGAAGGTTEEMELAWMIGEWRDRVAREVLDEIHAREAAA